MEESWGGGGIDELVHGAQETVDSHLLQKQSEASRQFAWWWGGGGATQLSSEQVISTLLLPRGAPVSP